ncbi:MAG: Na+/H+ antiporter NhaC family protein [Alistipes sp.]|nr:Na+/H+ antiporter NhaC family protein [Alistipes sp.]MBQ5618213.1 Na+/H+ antiporter NhaC family protein [Alistipes sp.]MBQ5922097.1 Na+/H+ antiporter NhaC family protein [Alistipes sp.]
MQTQSRGKIVALLPLVIFLGIYLVGSLLAGDFYKISITIAGMVASIVAVAMTRQPLSEAIGNYSRGATDQNIMLMIWIFVLAGAFAASTKAMGAVDATVALTLRVVPEQFLPAGIFIAACFTSISIGTSVGTIVALTPIASAIAEQTGSPTPWLVAIVVGGALFGDNLSFISDTTIAATRTQGCSMRDKFRTNVKIVTPAAIVTLLIYIIAPQEITSYTATEMTSPWYTILPYLLVLVLSAIGTNVLIVLTLGILTSGAIGLACGQMNLLDWFSVMGEGIDSMGQLIIITMMAGGMLEMIRINGGIDFIISRFTSRVNSRRAAEGSIAALVMFADICTANNTVAIISVGSIARQIADRFGISPRRTASLLDTFSCCIQGILPYGAQLLMAAGLASISPVEIIPHLYYPMIMGGFAIGAILLQWPRYDQK